VKLHAYGVGGVLLQWIKNLFSCRTIQTRIYDLLSDVCNLQCGVIRGSIIGPLMFLVYINDLVELLALASFNIKVKLFADETIYVRVLNVTDSRYGTNLLLLSHGLMNGRAVSLRSVEKCCVLHIDSKVFHFAKCRVIEASHCHVCAPSS